MEEIVKVRLADDSIQEGFPIVRLTLALEYLYVLDTPTIPDYFLTRLCEEAGFFK